MAELRWRQVAHGNSTLFYITAEDIATFQVESAREQEPLFADLDKTQNEERGDDNKQES
jgi:hypothetical protein